MRGRGGAQAEAEPTVGAVEDLGAGERILGYATRRFRATAKDAQGREGTMEMWFADVGAAGAAMQKFSESFGAISMGNATKAASAAVSSKIPKGAVLLRAVINATTDRGKMTSTIETTDIKTMRFDAGEFEIPAGINVMDMSAMMGGRGRGRGGN
jgi:hypothetical protein